MRAMKSNIDEAFLRRFDSIIHFTMPTKAERHQLWFNGFSKKSKVEEGIDLKEIATNFEVTDDRFICYGSFSHIIFPG